MCQHLSTSSNIELRRACRAGVIVQVCFDDAAAVAPAAAVAAGLEGKKVEAEAYIDKQAERLRWSITGNTLLQREKEVRAHINGLL